MSDSRNGVSCHPVTLSPCHLVTSSSPIPTPKGEVGLRALKKLWQSRNILATLELFHEELGDVFQLPLPGFSPVFLVGPEANRFVLVTGRDDVRWRAERDPVTALLRHGVLVVDGPEHDDIRRAMNPALHKRALAKHVRLMWRSADEVMATWDGRSTVDMLLEMRRMALLITVRALYRVDFSQDMDRLWPAILRTLAYISPGAWLIWPSVPRPGYARALRQMDDYLFHIIRQRRANLGQPDDLLGLLIATPGFDDDLIRDQLLTMLIAGHDTSTALLAWTLHLLGSHPPVLERAQAEVDGVLGNEPPAMTHLGRLTFLDQVINESLRLYPPIHIGNRMAAIDLEFQGYRIPAGTRVAYSIYLTHRHPAYWPDSHRFDPGRFSAEQRQERPPYTFVPFGGGPRNCIGMAFAQVEAKVVLARILQQFNLAHSGRPVHPHMGATLEPRPAVMMKAKRRERR